eukprot:CAMPEP_0204411360 /NCGR_PEP_ID=MMETSP0470-20130426/11318_1 /ASSEMBLY_ACC=CAM_ASM_000385 /TAXON_ID=2969 /ORGANISM="Oxyrrhis marina" /LENGTH=30 /DNA_ID= /DNA_START= /DNA_END= /DNA_ORIENTATION=
MKRAPRRLSARMDAMGARATRAGGGAGLWG